METRECIVEYFVDRRSSIRCPIPFHPTRDTPAENRQEQLLPEKPNHCQLKMPYSSWEEEDPYEDVPDYDYYHDDSEESYDNDPFNDPDDPYYSESEWSDEFHYTPGIGSLMRFYRAEHQSWEYDTLQGEGALIEHCMRYRSMRCPIERSTLTLEDLRANDWDIFRVRQGLPSGPRDEAVDLGYPDDERSYWMTSIEKSNGWGQEDDVWMGRSAYGVLFIENILRTSGSDSPWISEISQAVYEEDFPIETLRHVFVTTVVNRDTLPFVNYLYHNHREELDFGELKEWTSEDDGEDFQALLGTRIGKIVAYLVLGAFERGTRRIARIVTWRAGSPRSLQMRFDIERVY